MLESLFLSNYVSVLSNDRSKGTEVDVLPTDRGNNLQNWNVIIPVLILLHHYVVSFLIFKKVSKKWKGKWPILLNSKGILLKEF